MLSDDFSITVPNDLLVVKDQSVAPSGAVQEDASTDVLLMSPLQGVNANDLPILGTAFLSAAYLMVDLDERTFTLWQANATTDTKLVPIGGSCSEDPTVNSANPNVTSPGSVANGTEPGANSTDSGNGTNASGTSSRTGSYGTGVSTGTIAGAVVGSAVGAATLAAALVYVVLKRRRAKNSPNSSSIALTQPDQQKESQQYPQWYSGGQPGYHEAASSQVVEMAASKTDPQELGVRENPVEKGDGDQDRFAELPGRARETRSGSPDVLPLMTTRSH